jgi:hypothetical protein
MRRGVWRKNGVRRERSGEVKSIAPLIVKKPAHVKWLMRAEFGFAGGVPEGAAEVKRGKGKVKRGEAGAGDKMKRAQERLDSWN